MCGIVASAMSASSESPMTPNFPTHDNTKPEILLHDENFTIYKEKANPVSSQGHIVVAFKSVELLKSEMMTSADRASQVFTYRHCTHWWVTQLQPSRNQPLILFLTLSPQVICLCSSKSGTWHRSFWHISLHRQRHILQLSSLKMSPVMTCA